jgi:hypothetical protein
MKLLSLSEMKEVTDRIIPPGIQENCSMLRPGFSQRRDGRYHSYYSQMNGTGRPVQHEKRIFE